MKIFLSVLITLTALFSFGASLDEAALRLHEQAFERAMVAFGLAKGLNSVISLIQGTQISLAPAGMGVSLSVGEVLDPFNDMVERFSWVMLFSSVSLGTQKLLLIVSSKLFLQIAIAISGVIAMAFIWIKKLKSHKILDFSLKFFILLILLRFGAIVFIHSSSLFYTSILKEEYQSSTKVVMEAKVRLQEINSSNHEIIASNETASFFESIRSKSIAATNGLNISSKLKRMERSVEEASKNVINLITIFLVQSVFFPLLFLWLFAFSVKSLFRIDLNSEGLVYNLKRL